MATCLQVPPMAASLSSSSLTHQTRKLRFKKTICQSFGNSANIPIPPLNHKDPFLTRLAKLAAKNPDIKPNANSDLPPYLDMFETPQLMASPAQLERSATYNEHRSRRPPPDLPSILLNGRIVFIGMPLVPIVTELVIAQLLYLQYTDPQETIYMYINSSGTTRADGETVGMETEGFAIYDAMMQLKNPIETVNIGCAIGQACLLLAAGKKGRRFSLPHATAMLGQPRVPSTGLRQASDVVIRAKEAVALKNILQELLAEHTGNTLETIDDKMSHGPFYMDTCAARDFGVIDKILWRGQEQLMKEVAPPEYWDKLSGVKRVE